MKPVLVIFCWLLFPAMAFSQAEPFASVYYAGINPVAPFTGMRSQFSSGYLPAFSNLETGASVFIGKIWNRQYNVETRLSYGSPLKSYRQFLVQSGLSYCFNKKSPVNGAYAGLFVKLNSLRDVNEDLEQSSVILHWSAGRRFTFRRYFADVRVSQHIMAVKWTNEPGSKAAMGFHPSIYKWSSPYVPFVGIGIGYILGQ
jgi:hypothetical protein